MPIPRDVAKERKLAMPSVTRTVKSLEKLNAVSKEMDHDDHRFFKMTLTPLGKKWYDIYVAHFYDAYAKELGDINEESALTTIKVIAKMNQAMKIITKEDFYGRD
jgi:DNA-binding MarR family transcriptional regulator